MSKERKHKTIAILILTVLLMALGVLALVMIATGYVPASGWSKDPTHATRFGIVAGFIGGLIIGLQALYWT